MTDKAITKKDTNRIMESWQGLTDYQEIIELSSEQLEAKEYLRVAILLDEYRSMAEYFLSEIEAAIKFNKFHNPENQPLDNDIAVAKCAQIEVAHKPVQPANLTHG